MSQADIDTFVRAAWKNTLTPADVATAVAHGVNVSGQDSMAPHYTALHHEVHNKNSEMVAALLAEHADPNAKAQYGETPTFQAATEGTAGILKQLVDHGGDVNMGNKYGVTPLIAVVSNVGDAAARLAVLLARPELNLDARFGGRTAEQWARENGQSGFADAIAAEVRGCPKVLRLFDELLAVVGPTPRHLQRSV